MSIPTYDSIDDLIGSFVEILLKSPEDFLKIQETLTRIGIASTRITEEYSKPRLFQSCHILHKKGKYYIVHFKELLELDNFETNICEEDIARRNTIANLLQEWGLLVLVSPQKSAAPTVPGNALKILSFREKLDWLLIPKYNIGKKFSNNQHNRSSDNNVKITQFADQSSSREHL